MKIFNDTTALAAATLTAGQMVSVKEVGEYRIKASGSGITLANGNIAVPVASGTAVNVKHFGVTGAGYPTDEGALLNNAANFCRANNLDLFLGDGDMRIYTTVTIDFSNLRVRGTQPAIMNFGYSAASASYGFDILSNVLGNRPTAAVFYGLEDRYRSGQMIYSDVASPIVQIDTSSDLSRFGVSGWIGTANQTGIEHPLAGAYEGCSYDLNHIRVSGCGGDGISLKNGIELSVWDGVVSTQNYGYGLTTAGGGGDNNQEYTIFKNCSFTMNRLDGVNIEDFKKNISFYSCGGNSNGWYGLGASAITKPADQTFVRAMVCINGTTAAVGQNFIMDNCYAEDSARMLTVLADYPIRNIQFTNNYMIPVLGLADTDNHLLYLERVAASTGQIYELVVKQNTQQNSARGKVLHGEMTASNIIGVEFDTSTLLSSFYNLSDFTEYTKTKADFSEQLTVNKHIYSGNESIGDGLAAATYTSDFVKNNMVTAGRGNNTHSLGACFLITTNWQATNANGSGAYLLYAAVMPSGQIKGGTVAMSSTSGFTAAPTLDTDGTLNVPLAQFYRASITRIDMNGERA